VVYSFVKETHFRHRLTQSSANLPLWINSSEPEAARLGPPIRASSPGHALRQSLYKVLLVMTIEYVVELNDFLAASASIFWTKHKYFTVF
jgi:hypothetical protein